MNIQALTDDELRDLAQKASLDLAYAAEHKNESEWHQACFAAMCLLGQEMIRRGVKMNGVTQ